MHKCSIVHNKNRPQKFATPGGRHIDFQYGAKMTIVLPLSPALLQIVSQFKCLYLCFRCLGTLWQCQNLRQEAAILDFKMAAKCFTLLCISLIIALWKENKDSLHLGKCLLSENCHHMAAISEFQDGYLIIRHAVFHDRQMSLTLSVVTEKVVISPFRPDGSHIQFPDDCCFAGPFQCHWAYQYAYPRIIVPVAYL